MAARKRTLAAFAAGALLVPLSPFAAFADHIEQRTRDNACPPNEVSEGVYTDVEDGALFEREINCVSDYGIATGTGGGQYSPEDNVSRRQMAQFVYREALLSEDVQFDTTTNRDRYSDVRFGGEAQDAIIGLSNAGVLKGVGGDRFDPNAPVTRAQMATFLVGLADVLGLEGFETSTDFFDDDDNKTPHEDNINRIASEGVTIGQGGDRVYGFLNPVLRQQMAAFLARVLDIAVEQGVIDSIFTGTPADVTINEEDVDAGDPITGTITGSNVESVSVAGDCVESGDVEDTDTTNEDSFEFSVPTNDDAEAGECEVTFTVTFENGRTQDFVRTVTINEAGGGTNERPELVEAAIVSTTTQGQVTPTREVGTIVSFTFDEDVLETGAPPVLANFQVFNADGTPIEGTEIEDVDGDTVTVRFAGIDTADEAADLTLATVDIGAVTDEDGDTNPEGDAPLGTTSGGGTVTLPAGITEAPDLVSVGNFRQGASAGQTAVDFTFDEAAFVNNTTGFALILVNDPDGSATVPGGSTNNNDNEVRCTGPAQNSMSTGTGAQPSGGTIAGGNGTTTITVICERSSDNVVFTAADVARATVDANTVSDVAQDTDTTSAPTGNANPLQAVDVSNSGNTPTEPDLVSVELRPAATDTARDQALFTFDQPVDSANEGGFALYNADGDEVNGTDAVINTQNRTQVLVTFEVGSTDDAVGGNVDDAAVTSGPNTTNVNADFNEQDEAGVANTSSDNDGQTAGRTDDPDLTSVTLARGEGDDFGNPGDFEATYTFDEDVTVTTVSEFRLFLADGTQLNGTNCTVGTTEDTDSTVTCTDFTTVASGSTAARAATDAEVGSAVLGTVDDGAVTSTDADAGTNPEGAEPTSGGNGTTTS